MEFLLLVATVCSFCKYSFRCIKTTEDRSKVVVFCFVLGFFHYSTECCFFLFSVAKRWNSSTKVQNNVLKSYTKKRKRKKKKKNRLRQKSLIRVSKNCEVQTTKLASLVPPTCMHARRSLPRGLTKSQTDKAEVAGTYCGSVCECVCACVQSFSRTGSVDGPCVRECPTRSQSRAACVRCV